MNLRLRRSWLAWLLPLMVLRAFVPVGFMLSWSPDGLQLALCTGSGAAVTWTADSDEAHAHHHHDGADGKVHENSYCPYALAASASAPTFLDIFVSELPPTETIDFVSDPELKSTAVLIDRIRGPPFV